MRRLLIAESVLLAGLWAAAPLSGLAQTTNTSSQASAQQQASGQGSAQTSNGETRPQKKPDTKTQKKAQTKTQEQPSSASGQTAHPAASENPFPEQVSRDAAKSAGSVPASSTPTTSRAPSTADSNPFPEAVSRSAAKAAGSASDDSDEEQVPSEPPPLPPGVSSSRSSSSTGESVSENNLSGQGQQALEITNPARAKEDTHVGNYYLATGNPKGAYLRYRDAVVCDPANVDAIFGLAEAARQLKKYAEAERNYHIYLAVMPDGPKAKQAAKALRSLAGKK